MIGRLLAKVQGWAVAVLAVIAVLGAAWLRGKRQGREQAETRARADRASRDNAGLRETIRAGQERANVDSDIAGRPAGDAGERLRDSWSRD